ncbi:MAG TPA: hypothetical protein VMD92_03330 [Acidobacteriaceae bacterium]|nr:hypothetical protein [Acidobacteriaceae bacterium]
MKIKRKVMAAENVVSLNELVIKQMGLGNDFDCRIRHPGYDPCGAGGF